MEPNTTNKTTNSLLLHVCCAGCGAYVSQLLDSDFNLSLFFYNSNIFPVEEYEKRKVEVEMIAKKYNLPLIMEGYDYSAWLKTIKGTEKEAERGKRCFLCYEDRIRRLADTAEKKGFDYFTTTLSVSPHKVYQYIKEIGESLSKELETSYFDANFKKNDGFKRSLELSRDLGLYRQDYCGCSFSRTERENQKKTKQIR